MELFYCVVDGFVGCCLYGNFDVDVYCWVCGDEVCCCVGQCVVCCVD